MSSCAQCKQVFQPGESILNALEKKFHTTCFVCAKCKKPFASSGSATCVLQDGVPLHEGCAKNEMEEDMGECGICHDKFGSGEPILALGNGKEYHQRCFVCVKCKKPFKKGVGYHVMKKGKPYHPDCATDDRELAESATKKSQENDKICKGCGREITAGFRIVPDVGHFHPGCFVCASCSGDLDGTYYVHPETEKPACKSCIDKFKKENHIGLL